MSPSSFRSVLATVIGMGGLIAGFEGLGLLWAELGEGWRTASFGASATLFFALPRDTPSAHWRTSLIANIGSAFVGVACAQTLPMWLAAFAAIVVSVALMSALGVAHPPGGATALLAVVGGESVWQLGWLFPWIPIGVGTAWLLLVRRLLMGPAGRPATAEG